MHIESFLSSTLTSFFSQFFRKGSPTDQEIHMLNEPVVARKMRFHPSDQDFQVCTSLEVYRENKEGNQKLKSI